MTEAFENGAREKDETRAVITVPIGGAVSAKLIFVVNKEEIDFAALEAKDAHVVLG